MAGSRAARTPGSRWSRTEWADFERAVQIAKRENAYCVRLRRDGVTIVLPLLNKQRTKQQHDAGAAAPPAPAAPAADAAANAAAVPRRRRRRRPQRRQHGESMEVSCSSVQELQLPNSKQRRSARRAARRKVVRAALQRMLAAHRWKRGWEVKGQVLAWLIHRRKAAELAGATAAAGAVAADASAEQAPAAAERGMAATGGSKRAADAPPQVRGSARASKGAAGPGLGPRATRIAWTAQH